MTLTQHFYFWSYSKALKVNVFVVKINIKHYWSSVLMLKECFKIGFQNLFHSFVVGAVSPAVVVPSMLLLQENGYGIKKGIPTLLMAASSLDDIIAITGFSTCLSIVFSSGKQKTATAILFTAFSGSLNKVSSFASLLTFIFTCNIFLFFTKSSF